MASTQVAIVPIWKGDRDTKEKVIEYASELSDQLDTAGLNVTLDDRENRNPGFKFNEHELHGIPLRIEVGPAEMGESEVKIVQRPDGEDWTVDRSAVVGAVETALDRVHSKLYASAEETLWSNVREATDREEILQTIGEQGGYVTAPWCGRPKCEDPIKSEVHAEVVMIPFEDDDPVDPSDDQSCALCDQSASHTAYFAQSH
jgi:prolyl-tRNA synthetase